MATWTNIADTVLEPGKPIRAIDARALRDNPIAIARGATGAPKIDGADSPVIETNAITNRNLIGLHAARITDPSIPVLTVSASNDFGLGSAAEIVTGTLNTQSTSFVVAATITIVKATGSARFIAAHRQQNIGFGPGTSNLQLRKNGSQIALFTTTSSTNVTRTVDSTVNVGDVFQWRHRVTGVAAIIIAENFQVRATDGYTTTPLIIARSDL